MSQRRNPEIPLYDLVPSQPDLAVITIPLRNRVMTSIAKAYLTGEIDYRFMTELTKRFYNPRLTMVSGALGEREIWHIDHPTLNPKPTE